MRALTFCLYFGQIGLFPSLNMHESRSALIGGACNTTASGLSNAGRYAQRHTQQYHQTECLARETSSFRNALSSQNSRHFQQHVECYWLHPVLIRLLASQPKLYSLLITPILTNKTSSCVLPRLHTIAWQTLGTRSLGQLDEAFLPASCACTGCTSTRL